MRVSQKVEYGLRAMLELSMRPDRTQVMRSADIARAQQIPEKFLELILVELRRAGLVASMRGPVGGHRLARDPKDIFVGEVWHALEGSHKHHRGKARMREHGDDPFKSVWEQVDAAIDNVVNHVSLVDVRKLVESQRTIPDFNI